MSSIEYSLTTILGYVCNGAYNFSINVTHISVRKCYMEGSVAAIGGRIGGQGGQSPQTGWL